MQVFALATVERNPGVTPDDKKGLAVSQAL